MNAPLKLILHNRKLVLMTAADSIATMDGLGRDFQREHGERLAACWNACHGLEIPDTVPPGALAALVEAARRVLRYYDEAGRTREPGGAYDGLDAALAPFTPAPDPAPVSPEPYAYAWKTEKGYLASQGRETWFESEPVGWALLTDRAAAEGTGKTYGIPGHVVPVYR